MAEPQYPLYFFNKLDNLLNNLENDVKEYVNAYNTIWATHYRWRYDQDGKWIYDTDYPEPLFLRVWGEDSFRIGYVENGKLLIYMEDNERDVGEIAIPLCWWTDRDDFVHALTSKAATKDRDMRLLVSERRDKAGAEALAKEERAKKARRKIYLKLKEEFG